MKVNH
jgi:hypothetical protein